MSQGEGIEQRKEVKYQILLSKQLREIKDIDIIVRQRAVYHLTRVTEPLDKDINYFIEKAQNDLKDELHTLQFVIGAL